MKVKLNKRLLARIICSSISNVAMVVFVLSVIIRLSQFDFPWVNIVVVSGVVMLVAWVTEQLLGDK